MIVSDIKLREKPTHGAVKRVISLKNDFLISSIGMDGIRKYADSGKDVKISDLMREEMKTNPEFMFEFSAFLHEMGEIQTIMLSTSWTYRQYKHYCEEISEEDYQALLKRCIETTGTAGDFFGSSNTDL